MADGAVKEWKYSTLRPKPNIILAYEVSKPGHRLGYVKRVSIATGMVQWQPRCFGCKWKSTKWYKAKDEGSRREWIAHATTPYIQGRLDEAQDR